MRASGRAGEAARPSALADESRATLALGTVRPEGPERRGSARREWGLEFSGDDNKIRSRALAETGGFRGGRSGSSELGLLWPSGAAAQVRLLRSLRAPSRGHSPPLVLPAGPSESLEPNSETRARESAPSGVPRGPRMGEGVSDDSVPKQGGEKAA